VDSARRKEILNAYVGHSRRFDEIASRRRHASSLDPRQAPGSDPGSEIDPLSERQLEVLSLIAEGLSNQEICSQLDVTVETTKTHVGQILERLGARSRAHAVSIGHQHGLLK
jgi:DNA-binding NarL/FixJ family response regulator